MNAKERIQQYLDLKGVNTSEFERSIGASKSYWRNTKSISADVLLEIVKRYPDISSDWLLMGKGSMLKSEQIAPMKDRLAHFLEEEEISVPDFCESIGMPQAYYLSMKGNIPESKLKSIIEKYPQLNIEWLMTGEGSMIKSTNCQSDIKIAAVNYNTAIPQGIPYYEDLPVSAGQLDIFMQDAEPSGWVNLPGVTSKALFPVVGCSMKPEINPGDVVGIVQLDSWDRVDPDKTYLIITVDDRMIKHLAVDNEDVSILWCISPNYPKFKINKSDIKFVYRISFCGKLM